jgi:hypothetical protein
VRGNLTELEQCIPQLDRIIERLHTPLSAQTLGDTCSVSAPCMNAFSLFLSVLDS